MSLSDPHLVTVAREIVASHQYQNIDLSTGKVLEEDAEDAVIFDAFSAQMVIGLYDNLSEGNQAKYWTMLTERPAHAIHVAQRAYEKAAARAAVGA